MLLLSVFAVMTSDSENVRLSATGDTATMILRSVGVVAPDFGQTERDHIDVGLQHALPDAMSDLAAEIQKRGVVHRINLSAIGILPDPPVGLKRLGSSMKSAMP